MKKSAKELISYMELLRDEIERLNWSARLGALGSIIIERIAQLESIIMENILNPASWGLYYLLSKYCSTFVDEVKLENVKMGLWSGALYIGKANIQDFAFKTDFMKSDQYPLRVVEAKVKSLNFTVPWSAWNRKAPEVVFSGINIVIETTHDQATQDLSDPQEIKTQVLAQFDATVASLVTWAENVITGRSAYSFLTKNMVSALLNNLKVSVSDLKIELIHRPSQVPEVSEMCAIVQISKMESYSAGPDFLESPNWHPSLRYRVIEIDGLSVNSNLMMKTRDIQTPLNLVCLSKISLKAKVSMKDFDLVEFAAVPSEVEISVESEPITFRLSRPFIICLWDLINVVEKWTPSRKDFKSENEREKARFRWKYAQEKVIDQVRTQLLHRSLPYVCRKRFYKEKYIKGYLLHLSHELVPQQEIGFSHCKKTSNPLDDPRYISAVYYDLETVLSITDILNYRREAVERHLFKVTGMDSQGKEEKMYMKKVTTTIEAKVPSVIVELFDVDVRQETNLGKGPAMKIRIQEVPFLLLCADVFKLQQISITEYSPILMIHNRLSHISTKTHILLDSLNVHLLTPMAQFLSSRKPIFTAESKLELKLFFEARVLDTVKVKLKSADVYLSPELLTAWDYFFAFCSGRGPVSQYQRELEFFDALRPSHIFQTRAALTYNTSVKCMRFRFLLLGRLENHTEAAVLDLGRILLKTEKWPADSLSLDVKVVQGFVLTLPKVSCDLTKRLKQTRRMFFTGYFSAKLFISIAQSSTKAERKKSNTERMAALYRDLNTPEYVLSINSKELLFDLTKEEIGELMSLSSVWRENGKTTTEKTVLKEEKSPLKIDLTTKSMRKAAKQVRFSMELECKGAVLNVLQASKPFIQLISHPFELSFKSKLFDQMLLFQCSGLEILDKRNPGKSLLFAVRKGDQTRPNPGLIHENSLKANEFHLDLTQPLIVTRLTCAQESEDYRNIESETEIVTQTIHVTLNPLVLSEAMEMLESGARNQDTSEFAFCVASEPSRIQSCSQLSNPDKSERIIESKLVLDWREVYVNCYYHDSPLYSFYAKTLVCVLDSFRCKSHLRLRAENLHCADVSKGLKYNRLLFRQNEKEAVFSLNLESKFPLNQASTSSLQVKIEDARLVYLHRAIIGIYEYLNLYALGGPSDNSGPPMSVEVLFLGSYIELPRNSIAQESQSVEFEKLTLKRSADPSSVFTATGLFEHENHLPQSAKSSPVHASSRLNQGKRQENLYKKQPENQGVRDLLLTDAELQSKADLILSGISVYYYKAETADFEEAKTTSEVQEPSKLEPSPQWIKSLYQNEDLDEEKKSDFDGERTPDLHRNASELAGRDLHFPAPSPVETGFISQENPSLHEETKPEQTFPTDFNWKIQADAVKITGLDNKEMTAMAELIVIISISTEDSPMTIQIQLEDNLNFYFNEAAYTFLMQTVLENLSELPTVVSPTFPVPHFPELTDKTWLKVMVISHKADLLFGNGENMDVFSFTWDSFLLTCSLMRSGLKNIEIAVDSVYMTDQRETSLLYTLSQENSEYEPYIFQSRDSDIDTIHANLDLKMLLKTDGSKDITLTIRHSSILIAPDLLSQAQTILMAVFDQVKNPPPVYLKIPPVIPHPDFWFKLDLDSVFFLLPSSYESLKSTILVLFTEKTSLRYVTNGDPTNGPGSVTGNLNLKIAKTYFSNFEQEQGREEQNRAMLLSRATLSLDYSRHKPTRHSIWASEQVLVHLGKGEVERGENLWHFSLTISEALKLYSVFQCLGKPSCHPLEEVSDTFIQIQEETQEEEEEWREEEQTPRNQLPELPEKTSPDIPKHADPLCVTHPGEETTNFSLSIAIESLLINVLTKDIHPFCSLACDACGTYQSQGKDSRECKLVATLLLQYFNQRTTAWEPAIEWSSWHLDMITFDGSTKVVLSNQMDKGGMPMNINISYALMDLLGGLWKNWSKEIEGSELSSATPYRFLNCTGLPISVYNNTEPGEDPLEIDPNDTREVARNFAGQGEHLRLSSINRYNIDIVVNKRKGGQHTARKNVFSSSEDFRKVKNVPIDTSDIHIIPLYEKDSQYDINLFKRSALRRVSTLKLKDRIQSFFIKPENELGEDKEDKSGHGSIWKACFGKKEEENEDETQCYARLLVVEVRWIQEHALKEILIRSSLTLINSLPTYMEVEFTTLSKAKIVEEVFPGKKLYIPLPVVHLGTIRLRPSKTFDWSREFTLSAISGVVNETELRVLEIEDRSLRRESRQLPFIPIVCNGFDESKSVPFSCALNVLKKNNNTIRRKVAKEERHRWGQDRRMPVFAPNARRQSLLKLGNEDLMPRDAEPDEDQGMQEEELLFQERELILSSIMSVTNALPQKCKIKLFREEENQEMSEKETISQGQTCHLFFRKFYETTSKICIRLQDYRWSNALSINFPKITEEKKINCQLVGKTSTHKLLIWLAITNDDFGCWRITVFAPFWILNKTGFDLIYAEPDLFYMRREAKKQNERVKEMEASAPPEMFQWSDSEGNEDEFQLSKQVSHHQTKDKSRPKSAARLPRCPHCKAFNPANSLTQTYICFFCKLEFSAEEAKYESKEKEESGKTVTCTVCQKLFPLVGKMQKTLTCPECQSFIENPIEVKEQRVKWQEKDVIEEPVKRIIFSAPGQMPSSMVKKSASNFSNTKLMDWSKFVIYSTSRIITKLKVAMVDPELTRRKQVISKWSKNFSLGSAGTCGTLSINMLTDMKVDLGVKIDRGKGMFHRTNIITFTPRYMLKCHNLLNLVCKQVGTERTFNIKPGELTPFNWPNRMKNEYMSVALYNDNSSNLKWSGAFKIHEQGEFVISLQNDARDSEDFIQVSIAGVGPTLVIQFTQQKKDESPPYLFRNYTDHSIVYWQDMGSNKTIEVRLRTLPPAKKALGGRVIPTRRTYTLDEEIGDSILGVEICHQKGLYNIDRIGQHEPLNLYSDDWHSELKSQLKKEGILMQKRRFFGTYKPQFVTVSDGWMCVRNKEASVIRRPINLQYDCVKAVLNTGESFLLYTCSKIYEFRAGSDTEAVSWVQTIMDAKYVSEHQSGRLVYVDIVLSGSTHIVSFHSGASQHTLSRHLPCCKVMAEQIVNKKMTQNQAMKLEFQLAFTIIHVSFIDASPQEILLLSLMKAQLSYYYYKNGFEGFQLTVDLVKLDNQQMQTMWPVVFAPFAKKKEENKKSIFVSFIKESVPLLDHIHYLDIYLQPLELRLEGTVLNFLLHTYEKLNSAFLSGTVSTKIKHKEKPLKDEIFKFSYADSFEEILEMLESPVVPAHELSTSYAQKKLYIEELVIQPFSIVLSVNMNSPIDSPLPRMFLISLASIGLAFTSIEAAEIIMSGMQIQRIYLLRSRFFERLIHHYYTICILQVYKILGSMEFLGNPADLVNTIKAGMKHILLKPAYLLMRNPTQALDELLRGSFGMVTETIHGVFSSASKLASGIGRGLALLTMDQQFMHARRNILNQNVTSIGDGLMMGLKQLSYGIIDGVASIVTSPIQGYQQKGVHGLVTGLGKGLVGTVVKPVSGLFDAFSATTSTLGKYARAKFEVRYLERDRVPRHFYKSKILYQFDPVVAQAQFILYRFNPVYRHEFITHFSEFTVRKVEKVLIITKTHIFYVKKKQRAGQKGRKINRENLVSFKADELTMSLMLTLTDQQRISIDCSAIKEDRKEGIERGKWSEIKDAIYQFMSDGKEKAVEEQSIFPY